MAARTLARLSREKTASWKPSRRPAWAPWAPHFKPGAGLPQSGPTLGEVMMKNGATDIGLAILSIGTTMSVWSAISPSWATYRSFFSRTPEERKTAITTIFLAGGASLLMNGGLWLVFRRTLPVIAGVASTAALLGMSLFAVMSPPPQQSTMQEKREEQLKTTASPVLTLA